MVREGQCPGNVYDRDVVETLRMNWKFKVEFVVKESFRNE